MTKKDICEAAEVPRNTLWKWQQSDDFNKWFAEHTEKAFMADVPVVHRNIQRMTRRKTDACKLYMQRFDAGYTEEKQVNIKINKELKSEIQGLSDDELNDELNDETDEKK